MDCSSEKCLSLCRVLKALISRLSCLGGPALARLGPARLGPARLGPARLGPARLGSVLPSRGFRSRPPPALTSPKGAPVGWGLELEARRGDASLSPRLGVACSDRFCLQSNQVHLLIPPNLISA